MKTILALQPNARQIGYALFEENVLVEWGGRDRRSKRTNTQSPISGRAFLGRLVQYHDPDVIVLPRETKATLTARNRFLRSIQRELSEHPHALVTFPRSDIRKTFAPFLKTEKASKQVIMELLVRWFPELLGSLPEPRRPWDCQDHRIPMFDAVSLAVTYLHQNE